MKVQSDFIVVGAGIVGLALGRELLRRYPGSTICIFEKERQPGKHASGRNSGVLHSGIYYPSDSIKARVCAEGRKALAEYCFTYDLPITRAGKVILPVRDEDDSHLEILHKRAPFNGVNAELIDERQLQELEPDAKSKTGKALYVPDAYVVDPKRIVSHLADHLQESGVRFYYAHRVNSVSIKQSSLSSGGDTFHFGHLFNAGGTFADSIAKAFGAGQRYTILPFKGIYYRLSPSSEIKIRHLIYAVPDSRVPFLGIHYAKSVDGQTFLGPTIVPAFGRENYTWLSGLNIFDTSSILFRILQQYINNKQGFRRLVHQEGARFVRSRFAEAAKALTPALRANDLLTSDKVGIRAQLLDIERRELVMDFLIERTANSTHILNAVSPAFTSSFAFAKLVVDASNANTQS